MSSRVPPSRRLVAAVTLLNLAAVAVAVGVFQRTTMSAHFGESLWAGPVQCC